MLTTRRFLILAAFLSALFLSATTANAQTGVSYRFLEVSDADAKPLADARVETLGSGGATVKQTDERGQVRKMPVYYGDFNTYGFKISKPGYIPQEVDVRYDTSWYQELYMSFVPGYDEKTPIKVVLLREPVTAAEREAAEAERRRRELLRAVKSRDAATAEKLLRARAGPDTTDENAIPVILFAAASGDAGMIKALLAAGADVRDKSRPGRKALLYYLKGVRLEPFDIEAARLLIKAGADVKAADRYGATVLDLARQYNNPQLVRLLEKAGAH